MGTFAAMQHSCILLHALSIVSDFFGVFLRSIYSGFPLSKALNKQFAITPEQRKEQRHHNMAINIIVIIIIIVEHLLLYDANIFSFVRRLKAKILKLNFLSI
jgi:hypothetical protein